MLNNQLGNFLHQHLLYVGDYRCLHVMVEEKGEHLVLAEFRITHMHKGIENLEASPDVVTGTLSIFSHLIYTLTDLGSTLLYVTSLIVGMFKRVLKLLV